MDRCTFDIEEREEKHSHGRQPNKVRQSKGLYRVIRGQDNKNIIQQCKTVKDFHMASNRKVAPFLRRDLFFLYEFT